jgi:hypothetical protein
MAYFAENAPIVARNYAPIRKVLLFNRFEIAAPATKIADRSINRAEA